MLIREEKEDHVCYKGEWQDDNSRIRLHYHKGLFMRVVQLEVSAIGIGSEVLLEKDGERECDFNF